MALLFHILSRFLEPSLSTLFFSITQITIYLWVSAAAAAAAAAAAVAHSWTAPPLWALRHSISVSTSITSILTTWVVSYACTWSHLHVIYCIVLFYFRLYGWLLCFSVYVFVLDDMALLWLFMLDVMDLFWLIIMDYMDFLILVDIFFTNVLVLLFWWLIGGVFFLFFLMMKGENYLICVIKSVMKICIYLGGVCMYAGGVFVK